MLVNTETRRVIGWVVIFTGVNVGVRGMFALAVFFLAAVLSTEDYAGFGMLYALQGAMTMFSLTGLGETTAARLKNHPHGYRRQVLFRRISGLFVITTATAFLLILPFALLIMRLESFMKIVPALLLGAVIGFSTLQAGFQRIEQQHAASLLSSAGIPFCCAIGLMVGGWWCRHLTLVFTMGLASATLALIILLVKGYAWFGPLPHPKRARKELSILGPYLIIAVFGWLSGYGMNFLIDVQFEPREVATFTFLFTAASLSQMIISSLNMAWAPRFYQMFNDGELVYAESRNWVFYSLLAGVLGVGGGLAVALLPWITGLIGGRLAQYGNFRLELAFLMAGYVAGIPFWHGQNYYHVAGFGLSLTRLSVWSGGAGLVVWFICMLVLGPIGIFIGFMLQMVIKAGAMWRAGNHHWQFRPPWAAIAIACAVIFAGLLFPVPDQS